MEQQITEPYCQADDFCKAYSAYAKEQYLPADAAGIVIPECAMSLGERMTIVIGFHLSGYRTFKWYYIKYVSTALRPYFPRQLSYTTLRGVDALARCSDDIVPHLLRPGQVRRDQLCGFHNPCGMP